MKNVVLLLCILKNQYYDFIRVDWCVYFNYVISIVLKVKSKILFLNKEMYSSL